MSFSRVALRFFLSILVSFIITITILCRNILVVLSYFTQLLYILRTRFVATLLAYLAVVLGGVCLDEAEDGLWLKVTDGRFVDGVITEPVNFILLIYFICRDKMQRAIILVSLLINALDGCYGGFTN